MKKLGSSWMIFAVLASALSPKTSHAQSVDGTQPGWTASSNGASSIHSARTPTKSSGGRKKAVGHLAVAGGHSSPVGHRPSSGDSTHRAKTSARNSTRNVHARAAMHPVRLPRATAESRRLSIALMASSQLRPMAQQLVAARSPAAYAGIMAYAAGHI